MAKGTVKWFNSQKGYGFIAPMGGGDVFVHISAVERAGLNSLNEGQTVEYEIVFGREPQGEPVAISAGTPASALPSRPPRRTEVSGGVFCCRGPVSACRLAACRVGYPLDGSAGRCRGSKCVSAERHAAETLLRLEIRHSATRSRSGINCPQIVMASSMHAIWSPCPPALATPGAGTRPTRPNMRPIRPNTRPINPRAMRILTGSSRCVK